MSQDLIILLRLPDLLKCLMILHLQIEILSNSSKRLPRHHILWHLLNSLVKDDEVLGPLSERMGVRERGRGPLLVSPEEMEAANFYSAFCFYKV